MVFSKAWQLLAHPTVVPEVSGNYDSSTIDSALGAKLNNLSIEERSNVLHDLHGVADIVEETPEMLKQKTAEMTKALSTIENLGVEGSLAYRKAVAMSPEYVNELKIRFLRAEGYNGEQAADRMSRFFDGKLKYFGEEKLVQELRLQDLGEEENEALRKGLCQVLPQRDRAGRIVVLLHGMVNIMYATHTVVSRHQKKNFHNGLFFEYLNRVLLPFVGLPL
jgi:hypothetical protein